MKNRFICLLVFLNVFIFCLSVSAKDPWPKGPNLAVWKLAAKVEDLGVKLIKYQSKANDLATLIFQSKRIPENVEKMNCRSLLKEFKDQYDYVYPKGVEIVEQGDIYLNGERACRMVLETKSQAEGFKISRFVTIEKPYIYIFELIAKKTDYKKYSSDLEKWARESQRSLVH